MALYIIQLRNIHLTDVEITQVLPNRDIVVTMKPTEKEKEDIIDQTIEYCSRVHNIQFDSMNLITLQSKFIIEDSTIREPTIVDNKLTSTTSTILRHVDGGNYTIFRGLFHITVEVPVVLGDPDRKPYFVITKIEIGDSMLRFMGDVAFPDYLPYEEHGISEDELDNFMKDY